MTRRIARMWPWTDMDFLAFARWTAVWSEALWAEVGVPSWDAALHCLVEFGRPPSATRTKRTGPVGRQGHSLARRMVEDRPSAVYATPRRMLVASAFPRKPPLFGQAALGRTGLKP